VSTTPNTTPTTIAASDVIALFIREARHRALQQTREKGGAAMYVSSGASQKNSSGKGRGGGKSGKGKGAKPKSDITCYNCGKVGHVKLIVGLRAEIRLDRSTSEICEERGSTRDASAKRTSWANIATQRNPKPLLLPAHPILQKLHLGSPLSRERGLEPL